MRAQSAAALLRKAVSAGEYAPGTKLNEVSVAERLGISRNTLREAFATLSAEGIFLRIPNRGVFIASPTAESIHDLYTARALIEPAALLWAEGLSVPRLDNTVTRAEAALAAGDFHRLGQANQEFHRTVVAGAGSALLDEEMDRLLARMRLVFLQAERTVPEFHRDFVPVNRDIVTLLQAGDRAAAADRLRVSIEETGRRLPALVRAPGTARHAHR